jgi:hypothetical protein
MREAKKLAGVSHADVEVGKEYARRGHCRGSRLSARSVCSFPRLTTLTKSRLELRRKANLLGELRVVGVVDPQAQRLTNPAPRLLERSPMRMAAADRRDAREPRTGLVALEDDAVLTAVALYLSHLFPRHGSRSRSTARIVPGGMSSPGWTGTVVWHRPHRTPTCEPRWRRTSQPRRLNIRRSLLPVIPHSV